jgi:hypothetical protein
LTVPGQINTGAIGGAGNDQPRDVHTLNNAVTFVNGSHTIKAGGEFRLYRFYPFQFFTPQGSFSFDRTFTRGTIGATSFRRRAARGFRPSRRFLLGLPSSGNREVITPLTIYKNTARVSSRRLQSSPQSDAESRLCAYEIETGNGRVESKHH